MAKQDGEDILMAGRLVTHPTQTKVQKQAGVGGRGASSREKKSEESCSCGEGTVHRE